MRIGFLLPVLAASQDDSPTLLSLKLKVHSTLTTGVDQLLDVVGSRNVTQMSALLQNLVEETINEDVQGPYELDGEVAAALDMIKNALLGDIRGALKEQHCYDQRELHERILCFEKCETAKKAGAASCGSYCDGSSHKQCRDDLLVKYREHVTECRNLDSWVSDFSKRNCPKFEKKCCLLSHTTWNCGGLCAGSIAELDVDASLGTWIQKQINTFETAFSEWEKLHTKCNKAYKAYVTRDAECDCEQAACETRNCEWETCHFLNCEDTYNQCWGRCEVDYEETNKNKECLEKDRKIDWSATEKIECYVNVLLEKPDEQTLLAACGTTDCYNKYREQMYQKCNHVCVEVDFEGEWGEHARRTHIEGDYSGHNNQVKDQTTHQWADIDVTGEGVNSVRTRHRGHGEDRCTSHLDLDYQLPPCCHPCEARPSPPCEGRQNDYGAGMDTESYMWIHYGQFGHFSGDAVADVPDAVCHKGEHTHIYAYNLCDCINCPAPPVVPPATCTHAKTCAGFEEYDYRQHDVKYECGTDGAVTTTTTTKPIDVPPSNCPTPEDSHTCHFWGDPHFTHLFTSKRDQEVKKGGRHWHISKLMDFNPSGVFDLATNSDGSFEAQAFFCPYLGGTTTGVAVAMRFGDDLIQIVRGAPTGPQSDDRQNRKYWAVLDEGNEEDYTEFYLNGERVSWSELGDAVGTRGVNVPGTGGIASGHAFMQQMKTNNEDDRNIVPVCVGNGQDTLVEVGTTFIPGNDKWPMVYEHSLTVRSSSPGTKGVCSGDADEITPDGEAYRTDRQKILFSTRQMLSLCGMCRLDMTDDGVCGAPGHATTPEEVCANAGADIDAAKAECGAQFDADSPWFSVCVMEACASGDGSVAISKIEEHMQRRWIEEPPIMVGR